MSGQPLIIILKQIRYDEESLVDYGQRQWPRARHRGVCPGRGSRSGGDRHEEVHNWVSGKTPQQAQRYLFGVR
jgi:hypothetical protein